MSAECRLAQLQVVCPCNCNWLHAGPYGLVKAWLCWDCLHSWSDGRMRAVPV